MAIWKSERSDYILEKALAGERIAPPEALALYESADFLKVMAAAREIRNRKNNPSVVTYTMFRVVNYTTFCNAGADDISSVVIEENVLKSYGLKTEEKTREFIRESGFTPVKRDLLYHPLKPGKWDNHLSGNYE